MRNVIIAVLVIFNLMLTGAPVFAASAKCEIVSVEGDILVLDCGKRAAKFEAGKKVKIKTVKKRQVEGC